MGITHGDIKPENIFIKRESGKSPKIRLADIDAGAFDETVLTDAMLDNLEMLQRKEAAKNGRTVLFKNRDQTKTFFNEVSIFTPYYAPDHIDIPREFKQIDDIFSLGKTIKEIFSSNKRLRSRPEMVEFFKFSKTFLKPSYSRPTIYRIVEDQRFVDLCKSIATALGGPETPEGWMPNPFYNPYLKLTQ
tara:strand:- start:115 stop:681 length:567 start_codon:yes stop_codon:yes gene_type:complete